MSAFTLRDPCLTPAETPRSIQAPARPTLDSALDPLVKWPGGKRGELERILAALPGRIDRYLEPFVGGGATFFAIPASIPAAINDVSTDLMDFYRRVQAADRDLLTLLSQIDRWWRDIADIAAAHGGRLVEAFIDARRAPPPRTPTDTDTASRMFAAPLADLTGRLAASVPAGWSAHTDVFVATAKRILPNKLARMRHTELRRGHTLSEPDVAASVEGALKAACYTTLRATYNRSRHAHARTARHTAAFFALREYAYAAMFRFNARGEFNVPYGGITYNRKNLGAKIAHLSDTRVGARLANTTLTNLDFGAFFAQVNPVPGDFVFLDPPYDSDFSSYDRNAFTHADHQRLADQMAELPCNVQMVIKSTPAVLDIYARDGWQVTATEKTYRWTIKDRNDRAATHLMITNYEVPAPT